MRVVFMGSPPFAVPTLETLHSQGHQVQLVVTQPDRPAGRGQKLTPPAVKARALELALVVFQPEKIKSPQALAELQRINPEVIVVVGYGQIIPRSILELPPLGCVNVHASLLPKYRGAAPINWAIVNGETVTGVTTMRIIPKLDAGDILLRRETAIQPLETAGELAERLAPLGAELLLETLEGLRARSLSGEKQKDEEATYAPLMKREDGQIDWRQSATEVFNRVRGFDPWPGAFTTFRGKHLHIRRARPVTESWLAPGRISLSGGLRVGCGGATALAVEQVQLEGKKRVDVDDFVHGYQPAEDELLGGGDPPDGR